MRTKDLEGPSRYGNWQEAMSSGGNAIAEYWLTAQAYNEGRVSSASFDEALRAMDDQEPATNRTFCGN